MELKEKLYQLRKEKNVTQEELAEVVSVSRQAISRWEMGSSIPSMEKLILLCEFYDVSIEYLFGRKEEPEMKEKNSNSKEAIKEESSLKQTKFFSKKFILLISVLLILMIMIFAICFIQNVITAGLFYAIIIGRVIMFSFVLRALIYFIQKRKENHNENN